MITSNSHRAITNRKHFRMQRNSLQLVGGGEFQIWQRSGGVNESHCISPQIRLQSTHSLPGTGEHVCAFCEPDCCLVSLETTVERTHMRICAIKFVPRTSALRNKLVSTRSYLKYQAWQE